MDKQDLKKILAGISVATLPTGAGIGCAQQQSTTPDKETAAPAQPQETKAPGSETPAPSSGTGSEKGAGDTKTEQAPAPSS